MIIDSSALISILREEPESAWIIPLLNENVGSLKMSAANYLEAAIVIDANDDVVLSERLDAVIAHFQIEIVSVNSHHVRIAREVYRVFGKGHHPAKLNFGDTFAYALARTTGKSLLFKGNDFAQTDIQPAHDPKT